MSQTKPDKNSGPNGQAMSSLRESEEKYRALYDYAPLSYQSLDEDGCFIDVNPAWLSTLGYQREEVIGKYFVEFLHPDWKPHFEKKFPDFKRRGYLRDVQFKIRHKDGRYLDISFKGRIGYWPDGSFRQTYCVFQDITARKQAEEELKRSNSILQQERNMFIAGPVVVFKWRNTEGWPVEYVSPNIKDVFGFSAEELTSGEISYAELIPAEDLERVVGEVAVNSNSGADYYVHQPYRIVRKDGKIIWIDDHTTILRQENGEVTHYLGYVVDITEQKQAEENLRKSEEKYKSLFENLQNGFALHEMVFDEEGKPINYIFLDVNEAFEKLTSLRREDLIGSKVTEVLPGIENDPADWIATYGRVVLTGESTSFENYSAGLQKWYSVVAYRPKEGQFAVLFHDISERKRVSMALQKAHDQLEEKIGQRTQQLSQTNEDLKREIAERQRAQEQLLDQQGQLRSLASELALTEERERRRFATDLHDSIGQGLAVVKMKLSDLTGCDSPEGGTKILNEAAELVDQAIANTRSLTFDLSSPVLYRFGLEAAVSFLADQVREQRGLAVTIKESGPEVTLSDDIQVVLFRAVRELLNNVAKHARTDQAQVCVRRTPERIVLQISDAGIGFDPAPLSTAGAKIAGFGLFNIRERLHYYGGGLELESAPGQGTRVTLTVPVGQNKEVTKEKGK